MGLCLMLFFLSDLDIKQRYFFLMPRVLPSDLPCLPVFSEAVSVIFLVFSPDGMRLYYILKNITSLLNFPDDI